jgi:hypothetical protein
MGVIQKTIETFEDSLKRTIGEELDLRYRVSKTGEVICWYEGIQTYDDIWHELNHAKSFSPDTAKIRLIESMTSNRDATFYYFDGNGDMIDFYWGKNGFMRIRNEN